MENKPNNEISELFTNDAAGVVSISENVPDLDAVREAIVALGYTIDFCDLTKVPSTYVELAEEGDRNFIMKNDSQFKKAASPDCDWRY